MDHRIQKNFQKEKLDTNGPLVMLVFELINLDSLSWHYFYFANILIVSIRKKSLLIRIWSSDPRKISDGLKRSQNRK